MAPVAMSKFACNLYLQKNSKRNISREDLKETDFIFKCEMGDDKKLKAVRISKQDVLNMEGKESQQFN